MMSKEVDSGLLPSWYRASGGDTDLMVLDFTPDAPPTFRNLNRKEICDLAQEQCLELFQSLNGAIRFRDIRVLAPNSTASDPIIMVRTLSCLVSLDLVRCLLTYDRMLLFIPNGADELIRLAKWKMDELSKGSWESEVVYQPSIDEVEALAMEDDRLLLDDDGSQRPQSKDDDSLPGGVFVHFPFAASSLRSLSPKLAAPLLHQPSSTPHLPMVDEKIIPIPGPNETKIIPNAASNESSLQTVTTREMEIIELSNHTKLEVREISGTKSSAGFESTPNVENGFLTEENADRKPTVQDFSIIALETVLWTAVTLLDREQNALKPRTAQVIQKAKAEHSESALEKLRQARKHVNRLLSSAERQVLALVNLTKNDRDMSLLSFKNIVKDPKKYRADEPESEWIHDHEDIEMLLENYIQRFDSVINDIRWLIEQTELAESSIAIDLDVARNRLLRMNITITAITAFSGIGAFVSGIFGMNLNSGLQETSEPPVFWIVAGTLFFGFLLAVALVLVLSRRL